ncbi:MAG: MFS transporter [Parachlamydia sp.]|nr:MFS transporter [Parachlamydia sp.]
MKTEVASPQKQLITLLIVIFFGFLGISMPYLIFPALFLNPDYAILPESWGPESHALLLGITLSAYPLGQFIGSPLLGALSDDYGRKRLLALSLVIGAVCNLATGLSLLWQNLALVILSRFAAGVMEGNIAIARAMAVEIKSIPKQESLGKFNAVANIAYLLGPLAGGFLADSKLFSGFTISTPFYITSAIFLLLSLLSAAILQTSSPSQNAQKRGIADRLNLIKRLSVLSQNRTLRFLLTVTTLFTLSLDMFYEFGPVYLTGKWSLDPSDLIPYNSALCLGLALGCGILSMRFNSPKISMTCMGGLAVVLSGIVLVENSWIMLALFGLAGCIIGIAVTYLLSRISDAAPDAIQGEVMGIQISLRVLGDACICALGGILLLISPKVILLLAALMAGSTALYLRSLHFRLAEFAK